uniref:Uncharacterized protein n=1 Tax=Glossina brevipalpis TaxID=37001 RepID=A0A1A9W0U6_9MUSC
MPTTKIINDEVDRNEWEGVDGGEREEVDGSEREGMDGGERYEVDGSDRVGVDGDEREVVMEVRDSCRTDASNCADASGAEVALLLLVVMPFLLVEVVGALVVVES